jgi:hypothetical protein
LEKFRCKENVWWCLSPVKRKYGLQKESTEALKLSYTKPFDITGKPMKGWVMVEGRGFKTDEKLKSWLIKARTFVKTLAPK